MEETDISNLDLEFKRYLQILRPYLTKLVDKNVIGLCNAWIQRLAHCSEYERVLRNKYVFSLCYQLARGALEDPFIRYPSEDCLPRIPESVASDDFSSEVECMVVNPDDAKTEVLYDNKQVPYTDTEFFSQNNDFEATTAGSFSCDSDMKSMTMSRVKHGRKQTFMCYPCPDVRLNEPNINELNEIRANNLVKKLRDIKAQNTSLLKEIAALKEESMCIPINFSEEDCIKVDHATSTLLQNTESSSTVKSLKCRLHEIQESRNSLIAKIGSLQEIIDNINDMKQHEIDDLQAKHKLEIINLKETIKFEVKSAKEKEIEDLKQEYDLKIEDIKIKMSNELQCLKKTKDELVEEKDKIIATKNKEIVSLNSQVEDLKIHLHSILEKFIEKPSGNYSGSDNMRSKAELLEKRVNQMEKNKIKYTKTYEAKVAQLQREKHLAECSLQLQIVRQRAQVVSEVSDENQAELTTALEKLETKYKEIVANVQATAIQRRMQDQIALESILQAACGIPNENNNSSRANGQFPKTMRNQNPACNVEIPPLLPRSKVGNICMGNKSFEEDSVVTGYCLNGERMGELFDRVYIPQRDSPENMN